MKNTVFSKGKMLLGAALFVLILMFVSCQPVTGAVQDSGTTKTEKISEVPNLMGTWSANPYEVYKITNDSFESVGTYEGNSAVVQKLTDTSGTIFIKYTKVYDWLKGVEEDPNDDTYLNYLDLDMYWYPLDKENLGKWYAISYKNLSPTSISISGALKASGKKSTETLEEAIKEFTIENGYFAVYSECTK